MYKTRVELESYITLDDGTIEYPFIHSQDNWILSEVHNRPDTYLSRNSDILYSRLNSLAGQAGIGIDQIKTDGLPIWHGTYYLSTGQDFVEALSVLDEQIKLLSVLYAQMLSKRGALSAGDLIEENWYVSTSNEYVMADLSAAEYQAQAPYCYSLLDCGSFLYLTRKDKYWTTNSIENVRWRPGSATLSSKFGTAYSFEELTYSLPILESSTTASLYAAYQNEIEDVNQGSPKFFNYIKRTDGRVDFDNEDLVLYSTGSQIPVQYVQDIHTNLNYLLYLRYITIGTTNLIYLITTQAKANLLNSSRSEHLFMPGELQYYSYEGANWAGRTFNTGINIEGVTYVCSFNVAHLTSGKLGMVLTTEVGDILFRESTDGINWTIPDDSDGVILVNPPTYNLEFPTLISTQTNGILVFFNIDFTYGVLDYLKYTLSRDGGITWETADLTVDENSIQGLYPQLVRTNNGNSYLIYHTQTAIAARKVYVQVG